MKNNPEPKRKSPWLWIPSLYFAEGLPYTVVMLIAVVFYKRMGISNTEIALYTSWLYLPWVIKPLWSPIVDIFRTKRYWIVTMQLLIGAGLGGVALSIPLPSFFKFTLGFFWLLAFSSATHDIAADGFYMLGLSKHDQTWFVGIRSTFYRLAIITGQGLLIIFAGYIESHTGLANHNVEVFATQGEAIEQHIDLTKLNAQAREGELRIICEPSVIRMNLGKQSKLSFDSLAAAASYWNANRGSLDTTDFDFEQVYAGLDKNTDDTEAGRVALTYISLSRKPESAEDIIVNFGQKSGDKSIRLITDTRLVFNQDNWNIPYIAVIQLDPKLKHASSSIFQARSGDIQLAWILTFFIMAGLFVIFFVYHKIVLPYPDTDKESVVESSREFLVNFSRVFVDFFTKEKIVLIISFILIYRFGEAQLVKIAPLFMLDTIEAGGLALTTGQYGFIYGTMGAVALTLGGILGGFVAARQGLKYWILWMALAMKFPDAVYVYLSYVQPDNFALITTMVAIEQFGYGFGFTAYMLFMITVAEGEHKTAHYAICTGFMALGMMIPGMFSGWLQELIGYQYFFVWVLLATIPGLLMIKFLPIDPEFGKKRSV